MKTRIGTIERAQNLPREWWGHGLRFRQRTTDWVTHTFREHNKEADLWAGKGARGRAEECVDTARITWREVLGICGFRDGSFDNGKCGGRRCPHGLLGATWMVLFLQIVRSCTREKLHGC